MMGTSPKSGIQKDVCWGDPLGEKKEFISDLRNSPSRQHAYGFSSAVYHVYLGLLKRMSPSPVQPSVSRTSIPMSSVIFPTVERKKVAAGERVYCSALDQSWVSSPRGT
jgi:hypothetical protein